MEASQRPGPFTAIIDEDRPHRVALLGGRVYGEPVPVEAIGRHPSRAPRPALDVLRALDRPGQAKLIELAAWRRRVTP